MTEKSGNSKEKFAALGLEIAWEKKIHKKNLENLLKNLVE